MMFQIEISFDGETRGFESEKPELVVGRSTPVEEVDVDLNPDSMVSRKHFILKMEYNMSTAKNEAWIHDQGSSRGTELNGERVTDPVKIDKEDVISVGQSELRVQLVKKPKEKSEMSFQEKVAARKKGFGDASAAEKSSPPVRRKKDIPEPEPDEEEIEEEMAAEKEDALPKDEVSPEAMASLLAGDIKTECAGFVAFSIEDLASAVNRYGRENEMQAISASVVQEDKGTRASFRALVVFKSNS